MPMLKKYSDYSTPVKELTLSPSVRTLQNILNYSKSVEAVEVKKTKKILINLN